LRERTRVRQGEDIMLRTDKLLPILALALGALACGCSKPTDGSAPASSGAAGATKPAALGGEMDVKLQYAGATSGKIGVAYAFVKPNGDDKNIEVYLFNDGSKAEPCKQLIGGDPKGFDKPLAEGTKALVWFQTTAGGEYKQGGEGSKGYLYVFYPEKEKSNRDYASGSLPLLKVKSLTADTLEGSIEDAKGDKLVKATFVAKVCP
jgi:hypothetical protein